MDIVLKIDQIMKAHKVKATINWRYQEDDIDILEAGEEFSDLLDVEFNFIAV